MGWLTVPGPGWIPSGPMLRVQFAPSLSTALLADATGEKIAFSGQVHWSDSGTHSISTVSFLPGTITSAGGSQITLSLQNVSLTSGPPYQPDEAQDQTVTFALSTLTSSTWATKTLGATRSVAHGDLLSVVWEYDAGGRLGSDALRVLGLGSILIGGNQGSTLKTGGSWAVQSILPNVIFTADDATIGTFAMSAPCSAVSSLAYNTGSAADEAAVGIQFPFGVKLSGIAAFVQSAANADFDGVLYSGTTALATVNVDHNSYAVAAADRIGTMYFSSEQTLSANTLYRIAIKPTTANSVTVRYFDVNAAAHLDFWLGQNFHYWTRVDAGAWGGEVTTRVPAILPVVSQVFL